MDSHATIPEKDIVFYCVGLNQRRLMTVINGISFYRSTGKNSKNPGTWLPHRGLREHGKTKRIYKPKRIEINSWPNKLKEFIDQIDLTDYDLRLNRLGNFYTLCLSAQMGGGFWETPKGQQLKSFLKDNDYLSNIDEALVTKIKEQKNFEEIKAGRDVNIKLRELGAVSALGIEDSYLPTKFELDKIKTLHDPQFQTIFPQLFLVDPKLTETEFKYIIKCLQTLKNQGLLDLIVSDDSFAYFFESRSQLNKLITTMSDKKQVSFADIEEINLIAPLLNQNRALINNQVAREIFREMIFNQEELEPSIELLQTLYSKKILNPALPLVKNKHARKLLLQMQDEIEENIKVLGALLENKLLYLIPDGFHKVLFSALNTLYFDDVLNENTIAIVTWMVDKKLLKDEDVSFALMQVNSLKDLNEKQFAGFVTLLSHYKDAKTIDKIITHPANQAYQTKILNALLAETKQASDFGVLLMTKYSALLEPPLPLASFSHFRPVVEKEVGNIEEDRKNWTKKNDFEL